jgi:HPt (histidine-containing phosphotransfer) domain-containing protein
MVSQQPPDLDSTILDKLRKLEAAAGPGLVRQVIDLFLRPLDEKVARLRALCSAADAHAVEAGAHALKGVAAQVGAARVADACAALEEAARAGDLSGAAALLERLEAAAAGAHKALSEVS